MPSPPPRSTCSQRDAVVAQLEGERHQRVGRAAQRLGGRDLRSDVDVHADEAQSPAGIASLAIDRARVLQRHAELVGPQAGGDVRMALRRRCPDSRAARRRLARLRAGELRRCDRAHRRLRVDRADARRDRVLQLVARLADAGEDDVARRESGAQRHLDLAGRSWRRPGCRCDRSSRTIASVEFALSA